MLKSWRFSVILIAILLSFAISSADVPQSINYQGRLTDATGAPVADGPYLVQFIIYDAAVGGVDKWTSGFQTINTVGGVFDVSLGQPPMPLLPNDLFTDTLNYLGITVSTDPEISPRVKFLPAAYAYQALRADSAMTSLYLGTLSASDVALTGHTHYMGEISDAVGMAFQVKDNWFNFDPTSDTTGDYLLDSVDITCPGSGYVMVSGFVGWVNIDHTTGYDTEMRFKVNNTNTMGSFAPGTMVKRINSLLPSGLWQLPFYSIDYFPIASAGTYRFYSMIDYSSGQDNNLTAHSFSISAVYYPYLLNPPGLAPISPQEDNIDNGNNSSVHEESVPNNK